MSLKANSILARNVKRIRKEKGLKSKQLAVLIEVNASSISILESGNSNPTLKNLEKIAQALDVSLSDLLDPKM